MGDPITDPAKARIESDLNDPSFLAGIVTERWRVATFQFPWLDFTISATELDGKASEYHFRAELTDFPATNPLVRIWDMDANRPLPPERRPKGNQRVMITFQAWGSDTVYRPWDRETGRHNNNAINLPHLAWRADRRLVFIFEDLHGILNLNARARRLRTAA